MRSTIPERRALPPELLLPVLNHCHRRRRHRPCRRQNESLPVWRNVKLKVPRRRILRHSGDAEQALRLANLKGPLNLRGIHCVVQA